MNLYSFVLSFFLATAPLSHEEIRIDFNHKQQVILPTSTTCLVKTDEDIKEDGFGTVSYQTKENDTLIVSYEKRDVSLIKEYFDKRIDLQSLIFDEEHDPSALTRMKELRLEYKKKQCPYSVWKIRYAKSQNDVLYEYSVPKGGVYEEKYVVNRLIKAKEGYFKISIECKKEHAKEALSYLSDISVVS